MSDSPDLAYQQALVRAFRMPASQTMVSRKSSITNAFVSSIVPVIFPTWQEIEQALRILQLDASDLRCAYCGDRSSEWDHLRPLVMDRRPTGYISEIANLVPSCGKCNQSKGNKDWKTWMLSTAKLSPTGRGHENVVERVQRLQAFVDWGTPTRISYEQILGEAAWHEYWESCERLIEQMAVCQREADELKRRTMDAIAPRAPTVPTSSQKQPPTPPPN